MPLYNPSGATAYDPGPLTVVPAGQTRTLSQAKIQRVLLPTDGAAATVLLPATPNDRDAVLFDTSGATIVNQATINPNGNNIESIYLAPGTIVSVPVTTGLNPGASGELIFEAGTPGVWRQW